jgi:hypothetical protein
LVQSAIRKKMKLRIQIAVRGKTLSNTSPMLAFAARANVKMIRVARIIFDVDQIAFRPRA